MFGAVRIRDDRGVKVALCKPRGIGEEKEAAAAEERGRQVLVLTSLTVMDVVALIGIVVMPVTVVVVVMYGPQGKLIKDPLAQLVVVVAGLFGTVFAINHVGRQGSAKRVKAEFLKIGRCASCGYSLKGLKVEEDGCVVCAECGGAWRRV